MGPVMGVPGICLFRCTDLVVPLGESENSFMPDGMNIPLGHHFAFASASGVPWSSSEERYTNTFGVNRGMPPGIGLGANHSDNGICWSSSEKRRIVGMSFMLPCCDLGKDFNESDSGISAFLGFLIPNKSLLSFSSASDRCIDPWIGCP